MNPFKVRKIIYESKKNGEKLVIEELSKKCGGRLHHGQLILSQEMFNYEEGGGFPRHWVKGLRPESYLLMWFYDPPKETDFSKFKMNDSLPSFGDMQNLTDVEKK